MRYLLSIYLILFLVTNTFSQSFTKKDFKISIDNYPINATGNTITLTKNEILKIKEIYANFPWAKITSFVVYFSSSFGTACTISTSCDGVYFCEELRKYFNRAAPGTIIAILPQVVNKSGEKIEWSELMIRVK